MAQTPSTRLSAAVLICTYNRPADLERCLAGIDKQIRRPDEVILTVRDDDKATHAFLRSLEISLPLRVVPTAPGLVAARNAGLAALQSDIVGMVDDDTVPLPDWLDRVCRHFEEDPTVGGVGGRDRPAGEHIVPESGDPVVGILQYHGRYIGNHHRGIGPARFVDLLKGANMSYRTAAVKGLHFDRRLRGKGAQPCEDLAFSMDVRGAGWKLLYDPEVMVDHYEGARDELRHYTGMLPITDPEAFGHITYNWVVTLWDHISPARRMVYFLWQTAVGTRARPGLVQALRFTPKLGTVSWQRFLYTEKALISAYIALARAKRRTLTGHASERSLEPQVERNW